MVIVPERREFIIERGGQYRKTLPCGIHYLNPFEDKIAFVQSMEEQHVHITSEYLKVKDQKMIAVDIEMTIKVLLNCLNLYINFATITYNI